MQLRMSAPEAGLLKSVLSTTQRYLEFGMGGSTILALSMQVDTVSVESDRGWIEAVLTEAQRVPEGKLNNFKPVFADIGPTGQWGIPENKTPSALWSNYYLSAWRELEWAPDFVLIDGRFRTACALVSLLACPVTTKIAIHDFDDGAEYRKNYKKILNFVDIHSSSENLFVFTPKITVNRMHIVALLDSVKNDYW